jgi:hypothetical protein
MTALVVSGTVKVLQHVCPPFHSVFAKSRFTYTFKMVEETLPVPCRIDCSHAVLKALTCLPLDSVDEAMGRLTYSNQAPAIRQLKHIGGVI